MATLIIRREPEFRRGMTSIQIDIDGRKWGTLWNSQPLTLQVAPGRHVIVPTKVGMGGQPFDLDIQEGETRHLILHDVETSKHFVGLIVLSSAITAIPNDVLGGLLMLWIKLLFFAVQFAAMAYLLKRRMQSKLRLSEDSHARVAVGASQPHFR